jgi:predicted RNA binding protein YcfA (HicA-like mRNA interferase family)
MVNIVPTRLGATPAARLSTLSGMPRQPRVTGPETLRALQRAGWGVARQRGSHALLRHLDTAGRLVTIPVHPGRILKPKTLASILDQAGLTVDEFRDLL